MFASAFNLIPADSVDRRREQARLNYAAGVANPFTATYHGSVPSPFPGRSASVEASLSGRDPVWQSRGRGPTGGPAPFTYVRPEYHSSILCSSNFEVLSARITELLATGNVVEAYSLINDCTTARVSDLQNPPAYRKFVAGQYESHEKVINLLENLMVVLRGYPIPAGTQLRFAEGPMRFVFRTPTGQYHTVTASSYDTVTSRANYYGGKRKATRKARKSRKARKTRARK